MKKVLLVIVMLTCALAFTNKLKAQCTVSNIIIQNATPISSTPTSCTAKFDMTFNIADNNGNKFIFIHAWLQNQYPDYFQCVNGQTTLNGSIPAPTASDLVNSFINIGLNNVGAVPIVLTTYPADGSVPLAMMDSARKVVLADGSANITLYGIVATVPVACPTPLVVVADLWSSQASNGQRAHCVSCGIRFSSGFFNVTGLVNCAALRYNATITNLTPNAITGFYRIFSDVNNDGYFTPASDTLLQNNTPFSIPGNGTLNVIGPVPASTINKNVFLVITQTSGIGNNASRVILLRSTQCVVLPVSFASFSASRLSNTEVNIKWQTQTEVNNRGFAIQKNMGNENWQTVAFINSQATGGNSNALLTYTYRDNNNSKSITQYRIQQTDLDNRNKLSEIRSVRGINQKDNIILYPNPSRDGRMNVVFEDATGTRDMMLLDMSGRTIKQWQGIKANSIMLESLKPGIYSLKVSVRETGIVSVEKIVVSQY